MNSLRELLHGSVPRKCEQELFDRLSQYWKLLEKWNARINLTASTDWEKLAPFFGEAIWAASLYPDGPVRHLDIGSGGGFPALVLRILRPEMILDLVESRYKRALFLETAVEELSLVHVRVHNQQLREFLSRREENKPWDVISWKGIRLRAKELSLLSRRKHPKTQFWIFHGDTFRPAPLEGLSPSLRLFRRERCPCKPLWYLSIYGINCDKRFT